MTKQIIAPIAVVPHHRKKRRFAEHEIYADCIVDHNTYEYLRVTIEVPRDSGDSVGEVFLNGKAIGKIKILRDDSLGIIGFAAFRYQKVGKGRMENRIKIDNRNGVFPNVGKATASIISDFVR